MACVIGTDATVSFMDMAGNTYAFDARVTSWKLSDDVPTENMIVPPFRALTIEFEAVFQEPKRRWWVRLATWLGLFRPKTQDILNW